MSRKLRESEKSQISQKTCLLYSTQSTKFNGKHVGDYGSQQRVRSAMDTHFAGFYKPQREPLIADLTITQQLRRGQKEDSISKSAESST